MSHILEALKKSEEKRQRDVTTNFMMFQTPATSEPKRRLMMPYLLLVALLLNAGIFLAWLHPWKAEKPKPSAVQTAQNQRAEPSAPNASAIAARPNPPLQTQADEQRTALANPPSTADKGKPKERSKAAREEATAMNHPARELRNQTQRTDTMDPRLLTLNELPVSIQKSLPEIKISLLYYHVDSTARLARINDQTLHEGEALAAGLRLEEITQTGVILNYQGYRFLVGNF